LNPNNGLAWHVVNEDLMIFVVFIKERKYKDLNMHLKDYVLHTLCFCGLLGFEEVTSILL
jgi:hypothetical protein